MNYLIKITEENKTRIIIEAVHELGRMVEAFLLKENYPPLEVTKIGKSENESYDLSVPIMKYYSLMILSNSPAINIEILAELLHKEFGGNLTCSHNVFYITNQSRN